MMKTKATVKCEKLWKKIKDNIGPKNSNSNYTKYMKSKFYSDEDFPLRKLLDMYVTIAIRSIFYDGDKYFPQVFLIDWL